MTSFSRNLQVNPLIMICPPNEFLWKFVYSFLVIGMFLPLPILYAQEVTPESCSNGLTEARNQLFMGDFEQAISLLQPCIDADAYQNSVQLVQAYELLANVYIAINEESQAREAITLLLEASPGYEPDPEQSRSDYVVLVSEVRALLAPDAPSITSITTEDLTNTVTWNFSNTPPIASFVLSRGSNPDSLSELATLSVDDLTLTTLPDSSFQAFFDDANVSYQTRYYYAVEAIDETGNKSRKSILVDITTQDPPEKTDDIAVVPPPPSTKRKGPSPLLFVGGGAVAGGIVYLLIRDRDNPPDEDPGGLGILVGPPPLP